ncbi:hypothetical protein GPECTOR_1g907 [Gonium pectorale]|uniref:Phosphatidate cytidylyltransferase n=1 Tax=Gonium pectorale TaxID=33097 RepID=A0A150H4M9_GONPE|nr:hypothetical protein GPECTOR_1g907 [Gonium pectorale]|eukprot:KXZ57004.1 hypothetical protein GPECTOR_1g907 [Gonium pectorale]
MFFILLNQFLVARELFRIAYIAERSKRSLPLLRTQQWYFFFTAVFWLYLRFIKNNLLVEVTSDKTLARLFYWALKHHSLISYSLYMAGFVGFVLSLKKGLYPHQFAHYAWTHMIILITTVPTSFFVSNIFSGLIWYVLPAFLIVANDICAYLAGFFFGRTPLIKLSPKKTWEGFFGGLLGTLALAFFLSAFMSRHKVNAAGSSREGMALGGGLDLTVFKGLDCTPDEVFVPVDYSPADVMAALPDGPARLLSLAAEQVPPGLRAWAADLTFAVAPIQLHALSLATFASIIAPFGGFFASGFKRAFRMKDFGDTIPGHGGVTDRFDCQIVMAVFAYTYYYSYISKPEVTLGDVLSMATKLNDHDQILLVGKLANLLAGEGLIPGERRSGGRLGRRRRAVRFGP